MLCCGRVTDTLARTEKGAPGMAESETGEEPWLTLARPGAALADIQTRSEP